MSDAQEAKRRSRKWVLAVAAMTMQAVWLAVMLVQMLRGMTPDSTIWLAWAGGTSLVLGMYGAANVGASMAGRRPTQ